jgi:hypothetical protein
MHTVFWLVNLKGRDHSEDLGGDGKMKKDLKKIGQGRCGLDSCVSM